MYWSAIVRIWVEGTELLSNHEAYDKDSNADLDKEAEEAREKYNEIAHLRAAFVGLGNDLNRIHGDATRSLNN